MMWSIWLLQVSFEELFSLQLGAEGVQSLLCLVSQKQKENSIKYFLNYLMMFLTRALMKTSILKQHKTDLYQYSLAPTSTAKGSTPSRLFDCFQSQALVDLSTMTSYYIFFIRSC